MWLNKDVSEVGSNDVSELGSNDKPVMVSLSIVLLWVKDGTIISPALV